MAGLSKKQLEIAMQMDPNNRKYQEAYGKLNAKNDRGPGRIISAGCSWFGSRFKQQECLPKG